MQATQSRPQSLPGVGHELHQRAVRIAEIDTRAPALGAEPLHWPRLDGDATALEMCNCICNGAGPFEAEIAVARLHRQPRDLGRLDAGSVHVELLVAEPIGEAGR